MKSTDSQRDENCPSHLHRFSKGRGLRPIVLVIAILAILAILQGCSSSSGTPGLYVVSVEDGSPGWIAETTSAPVWSPNGDGIAWADEDGLRIHIVAKGSSYVLSNEPITGKPAWSPNGAALAYISNDMQELVVVDAIEGVDRMRVSVSTDPARAASSALPDLGGPSWSPDGSRLAFSCWDGSGDEVCLIDTDGANRIQMTNLKAPSARDGANGQAPPADSNVGPAAWSPDGAKIAVAVYPERGGATAGVFVIDLQFGSSTRISTLMPNSEIVWSLDGKSVLFSTTQKGRSDALQMFLQGTEPGILSGNLADGASSPVLSPNDTQIAVSSGESIVVLETLEQPTYVPNGGLRVKNPAWSPSGKHIAFTAVLDLIHGYD